METRDKVEGVGSSAKQVLTSALMTEREPIATGKNHRGETEDEKRNLGRSQGNQIDEELGGEKFWLHFEEKRGKATGP